MSVYDPFLLEAESRNEPPREKRQRRLEARKREAERPYLVCCCGEPARTVNEVLLCSHETKGVR